VGVDDSAVFDAQLFEAVLPVFEFGAVSARERDVIQTGPVQVETAGPVAVRERVQSEEQAAADGEDDVPERPGVLVKDGVGGEEL